RRAPAPRRADPARAATRSKWADAAIQAARCTSWLARPPARTRRNRAPVESAPHSAPFARGWWRRRALARGSVPGLREGLGAGPGPGLGGGYRLRVLRACVRAGFVRIAGPRTRAAKPASLSRTSANPASLANPASFRLSASKPDGRARRPAPDWPARGAARRVPCARDP